MKTGPMRWTYRLVSSSARISLSLLFGLQVRGIERVPLEGKLLIVSNHISEFDPPLLGGVIPREIYFAAKINLFKGILGKILRHLNAYPVKRSGSDKEAIKYLTAKLKEGNGVLIFPEGTRAKDPLHGLEPKAGVGMLAMMAQADVLPVYVEGTHQPKKALFRRGGFKVRFGEVVKLEELLPEGIDKREAYHKIAEEVMKRIRNLRNEG